MNSKRKGNAGEIELLAILRQYGEAVRNDQTFIGGQNNPDISFTSGTRRYHIECKRTEHLQLHEALRQAERDAAGLAVPAVVHRRNREPWYITLKLSDFLQGGGEP